MTTPMRFKFVAQNMVEKSDGAFSAYIGLEHVESGTGRLANEPEEKAASDSLVAEADDVLFGKLRPYLAKTVRVRRPLTCSGEFLVLRPRPGFHTRFIEYVTRSQPWLAWADATSYGSKMPRTSWDFMGDLVTHVPPIEQQRVIADFLDCETAKIDTLIDKQEQLIATLREDRAATISHAVTKGLNPGVELANSESGLPAVPAHWSVGPVKRFLHSLDHRRIPLSTTERGVRQGTHPYYGASGVIDFVDDYLFDEPLLLVSEDGANLLGRRTPIAFVAAGKYWVNNHAHILKPIENEPPSFWAYRIETASIAPFVTGSAQPKFTIEALMNMPITAPPTVTERREIVGYLEHRCSKIDALIAKSTEMIGTLREYRSALITNAVTEKIDVREAV